MDGFIKCVMVWNHSFHFFQHSLSFPIGCIVLVFYIKMEQSMNVIMQNESQVSSASPHSNRNGRIDGEVFLCTSVLKDCLIATQIPN